MPCTASACDLDDGLALHPCSVCKKPVHHVCRNELFEGGSINLRFCSPGCVYAFHNESLTPRTQFAEAQLADDAHTTSATSAKLSDQCDGRNSHSDSVLVGPPELQHQVVDREQADDDGIPSSVTHGRPPGSRGDSEIWEYVHKLKVARESSYSGVSKRYCSVCLVCSRKFTKRSKTPWAWERALNNITTTSNGISHFISKHPEHTLAQVAKRRRADAADAYLENNEMTQAVGQMLPAPGSSVLPALKRVRTTTIHAFLRPSIDQVNNTVSKWLIDGGLPFNMVKPAGFLSMIRTATGNPTASLLSAQKHNSLLDARYSRFCDRVGRLLQDEHGKCYGAKFLSVQQDAWTSSTKSGIVGASAVFIDHKWRFRHLALLAGAKNDGHQAHQLAELIVKRCTKLFHVDIAEMAQYMVSDTASAARKVSETFGDSVQTDCAMHRLNLCLSYGLGLKENTKTTTETNPAMGTKEKVTRVVTKGGALPEGSDVIRKMRSLNNYFSTSQRVDRLAKVQEALNLPRLLPMCDVDVRVGSTCKVMKRSAVLFSAFQAYFQTIDPPNPFSSMTSDDWELLVEMEAVTDYLSHLALVEVQRESMVASYLPVFRRCAMDNMCATTFNCYDLESPRDSGTNEMTLARVRRSVHDFSAAGKRCIQRLKAQLDERFPVADVDVLLPMLCDPRTKDSVVGILRGHGSFDQSEQEAADAVERARQRFAEEHLKIYRQLHSARHQLPARGPWSVPPSDSSHLLEAILPRADGSSVFSAPIPTTTTNATHEASVRHDAEMVVKRWMDYNDDWVAVAHQQQVRNASKSELMRQMCARQPDGEFCWDLIQLYNHVDICQWFRETGEALFPSIALLSRLWLGRSLSTAYQERVFSSAGAVMTKARTRTEAERAEKQVILKHNAAESARMETELTADARSDNVGSRAASEDDNRGGGASLNES